MKKMKRVLALICAVSLLVSLCALTLTGCDDTQDPTQAPTDPTGATDPTGGSDEKISYGVTLKSAGGLPLSGVTLFVYADETLDDMEGYGLTDETGTAVIELKASSTYRVVLADAPEGYSVEASYPFVGNEAAITLTSQVIEDDKLPSDGYKLGSVMHDITITDITGTQHKLSEILKEKDFVMLNYWYTNCYWCVEEFPGLESAYQDYLDEMEIFALDVDPDDSMEDIQFFQTSMALSFPMGQDTKSTYYAFNASGTPLSVFIDRYGVVCLMVEGAIGEATFANAFAHFTAENYTQTLITDASQITPVIKPDVQMPTSEEIGAVLNKGDITVTYSPEPDDEMSWPFVIAQKDGVSCISASNAGVDNSYATLYAKIQLKKGQAIALDYLASCESSMDILYVLVDRKDIYQISGESSGWKTCYPFVALEDGEYELALCYLKDSSNAAGDDTVYLKNLRVVSQEDIDVASYIPRYCANNLREDGFGYENYVTVVYNKKDGYYHVGTTDGPLLLANLMGSTRFSNDSVYAMALDGKIVDADGKNYYEDLLPYFTMASNSELINLCTVNQELMELLKKVADAVGLEETENQWLQMCVYYDVYGTGGAQLADPVRGLSAKSAIPAVMGKKNYVTYNRVIMPRGLLYKFVPSKSGVYRITSDSDMEVNGWVFREEDLAERNEFYVYEGGERLYNDPVNVSMVLYMEAGKEYYIDIAYYDVYQVGTFSFQIEYVAKTLNHFVVASPGYFTYYNEDTYAIEAGGIDVVLYKGYYYEKLADGSRGSMLYADFSGLTNIFSTSLYQMAMKSDSFNFSMSEDDQLVLDYLKNFKTDDYKAEFKALWGEDYEANMELLQVEDVVNHIYHGKGKNMTAVAQKYAKQMIKANSKNPEQEGCVPVSEELAELLQMLMDKFTFAGVDHSWTKLCYYYDYLGPDPNK